MNLTDKSAAERAAARLGYWSALLTAILAAVTLGIAIATPPISGPFCVSGCVGYPYTDIVARFPRDYYWMYPAMLLMVALIVWAVAVYHQAPPARRALAQAGAALAGMAAAVILLDYFVQVTVVQPSLLQGELDGISLLTQYNPHGAFIALEELGYLLMSLSFALLAPAFAGASRTEKALRGVLWAACGLSAVALAATAAIYGLAREYRFEVMVISIDFLALMAAGALSASLFHRAVRGNGVDV